MERKVSEQKKSIRKIFGINHNLLRNILKEKFSFSDNCAKSFTDLIEQWESADGRELGTGIPQGPQASGIVAEAVLQEYDTYIETLQKTIKKQLVGEKQLYTFILPPEIEFAEQNSKPTAPVCHRFGVIPMPVALS